MRSKTRVHHHESADHEEDVYAACTHFECVIDAISLVTQDLVHERDVGMEYNDAERGDKAQDLDRKDGTGQI